MSSQSSLPAGSGSQGLKSPLLQEFPTSTQLAGLHKHAPDASSWIPEGREAVRTLKGLKKQCAPGCVELVVEARVFFLAEIFFVRRCAWDDNLLDIAKESLSTMATVRVQYMRTKRPKDPSCLPLEPGGHSLRFL
jgi:hypothetical protein